MRRMILDILATLDFDLQQVQTGYNNIYAVERNVRRLETLFLQIESLAQTSYALEELGETELQSLIISCVNTLLSAYGYLQEASEEKTETT
jgi:hypothetical protein